MKMKLLNMIHTVKILRQASIHAKKGADLVYLEDAGLPFDPRGLYHAKILFEALRAHGYYLVKMDAASYAHFLEEDIIEVARSSEWELDMSRRGL